VSARVLKRPRAKVDLLDHFVYIGERGSLEKAEEFLKAVERAFELLAGMPEMGRAWLSSDPRLDGIRAWPLREYPYLILYRPLNAVSKSSMSFTEHRTSPPFLRKKTSHDAKGKAARAAPPANSCASSSASSSTATPRRQDRLMKALLTRKPIRDAPVLEVLEPNLRRRIDQKLLAALDRGEALPGEHVMAEFRKKHQARARRAT
jgi:plasmid stabilization system protein ParE